MAKKNGTVFAYNTFEILTSLLNNLAQIYIYIISHSMFIIHGSLLHKFLWYAVTVFVNYKNIFYHDRLVEREMSSFLIWEVELLMCPSLRLKMASLK